MKHKIISKFKQRPKTKIAYLAMWLGLAMFFSGPILGIFVALIRPMIDENISESVGIILGFTLGFLMIATVIISFIVSIRAYHIGERSWVMWLGLIPAILAFAFWIFMFIGEFIFPH